MHVWKNDPGETWEISPQIEVVSDDGVDKDQEDDVFARSTYETTSPPQFFEPAGQTTCSPLALASSSSDATVVQQPSPSARAESKAPRDINGNIDSTNLVEGKRHRKPRPPHHASHSVKLAVGDPDDCYTAASNNKTEEKQKRMDANIAAARRSEIKGLYDANQAYIHAPMEDLVYAVPPDDFKKPDDPFAVWLVLKALYGSPQTGRRWHNFIAKYLRLFGKSFPPAFVRDPTSLPWYENLKARLAKHQFKYKALGDVKVRENRISVRYIPSHENLADIFTKPLPTPQFRALINQFTVKLDDYLEADEDSIPAAGVGVVPKSGGKKKKKASSSSHKT
eukprot:g50835.t1